MEDDKLFDQLVRTYNGRAIHSEDTFSFLNRSARPAAARVRSVLEEWFSRYPDAHRLDLKRRFSSGFQVGFFELLLHELLVRSQYEVDVHPELSPTQPRQPDFRARDAPGNTLYLEAAVVRDESRAVRGQNRMLGKLYDQINQLSIPDYFLDIIDIRNPEKRQPHARRFKKFVRECLQNLNYDEVMRVAELGTFDDLPSWTFKEESIEIDFGVIPVSRENRGKLNHRPIGMYPGRFQWRRTDEALRDTICHKSTWYGSLNAPYLIAVSCPLETDKIDEMQALFGTEEFVLTGLNRQPDFRRKPDGVWFGPTGPKNTRVSGVLIAKVLPWNLPKAEVCLYHNPWAAHPYQGPLTNLPRVVAVEERFKTVPGSSLGSLLSLPEEWPGKLFDS